MSFSVAKFSLSSNAIFSFQLEDFTCFLMNLLVKRTEQPEDHCLRQQASTL